jgi:Tol biopolymer transport system component
MQRNRIIGVVAMILVSGVGLVGAVPSGATAPGTNGRIAYSRFADADFHHAADIVSANPDGTGVVKLTTGPDGTFDYNPDWSPDGSKIAFERDRSGCGCVESAGPSEIFTMNADGSDVRQITFDEFPGAGDPAWSPDGTRIAVQRFDIPAGRDGIYIMNADGSHPVQVTQNDARLGENEEPQWSPDGTKLVFQIVSDTKGSAIFTVNIDGTNERRLTSYGLDAEHADWSPDGSLIVFASYGGGAPAGVSTNVFTVRPDGTDLTQVTQYEGGNVNAQNPAWAPDGTRMVFAQRPGSGRFGFTDIYTMKADGSDMRPVTSTVFFEKRPDWGSQP